MTLICPVSHICGTTIYFFPYRYSNPGLILDGKGDSNLKKKLKKKKYSKIQIFKFLQNVKVAWV